MLASFDERKNRQKEFPDMAPGAFTSRKGSLNPLSDSKSKVSEIQGLHKKARSVIRGSALPAVGKA